MTSIEKCEVIENKSVAPGHFVLRLRSKKVAKSAKPGQFVQILCGGESSFDPLLARPFSFLTARGSEFSVLYHVVGKGTELMHKMKKRDRVQVLGPLGNGFTVSSEPKVRLPAGQAGSSEIKILVGGGVGIPPLYHLAETAIKNKVTKKENIHVFLGARNKSLLLCEKEFKKLGVSLRLATDDGSKGSKGFVTLLLTSFLQTPCLPDRQANSQTPCLPDRQANSQLRTRIYTCGPTPMLKVVSHIAGELMMPCEVAVEVPMACGFGACLGCAIKVNSRATCATQGNAKLSARISATTHRYAIACVEGPVFQGSDIVWD
jgi:dihydroorotate dehydrogenase electron transfer subunit